MLKTILFICSFLSVINLLAKRKADIWEGPLSDDSVQKAGYAYYFCDKNESKCYAVRLTGQDITEAIRILDNYSGSTIDGALGLVGEESEDKPTIVLEILRDFKSYRNMGSLNVKSILEILRKASKKS